MDGQNVYAQLYRYISLVLLILFSLPAFADVIGVDTIIQVPTTYSNTTLDMSHGNFIVRKGAKLTIENCTINGTISSNNTNLISVELGAVDLINNRMNIDASTIKQDPRAEASFFAIKLGRASATLNGNTFNVNNPFTVGLFTTSTILPATDLKIINNEFQNFHGVLYLLHSYNSFIDNNYFKLNSSGHIVIVGSNSLITNNSTYFSGLNQLGDAIDIVAAENVTIAKNNIFTPTSIGIAVTLSRNVLLDRNTITGGITYGIYLLSQSGLKDPNNFTTTILSKLDKAKINKLSTENITIKNNYLGQNRYGIAAADVSNLTVTDNFFTQRFTDAAARKFWTDNAILLQNVSGLTWTNNIYKEAFTQINGGDNSMTQFVPFPETGGVVL